MSYPSYHPKSEAELRQLIHDVWEGKVVGTWQYAGRWRELERDFPEFDKIQGMKAQEQGGGAWHFRTREAAIEFASIPFPSAGYRPRPADAPPPAGSPAEPPALGQYELLSWPEWDSLKSMLEYPPRAPRGETPSDTDPENE